MDSLQCHAGPYVYRHRTNPYLNFGIAPLGDVREHFWSCVCTESFGLAVREHVGVGKPLLESEPTRTAIELAEHPQRV